MIALLNLRFNCRQSKLAASRVPFRRALSMVELKKYYNILNVTKDSTNKEIKDSFLKLSKVYHPDNKITGSHTKFVQLKEAYDAIKDGHPATTSSAQSRPYTSSAYSPFSGKTAPPNSYAQYDYYSDLRYQSMYRDRQNSAFKMGYGSFGGPYANSSTPWEDLKRDQEYRRRQQAYNYPRSRPLVSLTLFFSAIAWIVIYSGVMLLLDMNSYSESRGTQDSRRREEEAYLSLQEARRRRKEFEARQISYKGIEMSLSPRNEPVVVSNGSSKSELDKTNEQSKTETSTRTSIPSGIIPPPPAEPPRPVGSSTT